LRSRYELTDTAVDELWEIWSYIAVRNVPAADRLRADIFRAMTGLVE
jgi:plasmid stabilization system protein ParE